MSFAISSRVNPTARRARDLGDGEPRRFRGKCRRPADPGVHLDDQTTPRDGVDGELHVRTTRLDAYGFENGDRLVSHLLVFPVTQGLNRCDRYRVTGVDAHRVQVLDRAHDHGVAGTIAHHLQLEFLPTEDRLLNQESHRQVKPRGHDGPSRQSRRDRGQCQFPHRRG